MNIYDLYVPFGSNCRPAYYLKKVGFRKCAYPLDWNTSHHYSIKELFTSRFSDFFDNYHEDFSDKSKDKNYRIFVDDKYDVECLHYIRHGYPLESEMDAFKKTMINRFERLDNDINKSKRILLLSNSLDSEDELIDSLMFMDKFYPGKTFTLLNVRDTNKEEYNYEKKISNNLTFIEYGINDDYDGNIDDDSWIGNNNKWLKILEDYYITC